MPRLRSVCRAKLSRPNNDTLERARAAWNRRAADHIAKLEADIAELRAGSIKFAAANAALGARITELEAENARLVAAIIGQMAKTARLKDCYSETFQTKNRSQLPRRLENSRRAREALARQVGGR
ncbi:hypothetical protein CIT31_05360 [Mesorhizobium wenxiniae]|uniref:Uncharacterized protein n=1 Tax=Mesorhizobium wenxiniae TaxID=2014805 RepID=A0A271KK92_9HYPH|nr:hypothetical protein CIT31_05360 [Mesorhizobium wenxiniae]